jgi:hypothetical protein
MTENNNTHKSKNNVKLSTVNLKIIVQGICVFIKLI